MSDIDDVLGEFDSVVSPKPAGGYERYIPNPAEAMATYNETAQAGWESWKRAYDQLTSFGGDPLTRIKGAGNLVLGTGQMIGAVPAAFGSYIGKPFGRAVQDVTGSPTAGQIAGGTVELAPALATPFPGAARIGQAVDEIGQIAPAAGMAAKHMGGKIAAKFAGKSPVRSEIDDVLDEFDTPASSTRKTSAASDVGYRAAEKEYQRILDPEKYGMPELPPASLDEPSNIRLLRTNKTIPGKGEKKYGETIPFAQYQGTPSFRTSHEPKITEVPMTEERAQSYLDDLWSTYQRGDTLPGQMPLMPGAAERVPGIGAAKLDDMYLPNIEQRVPVDPNLQAELMLKFGGRNPGTTEPPYMPQQTAGQRPPSQMPIPGARPYQEPTPNVILPESPVAMSPQAAQQTNRLRQDMGLPLDQEEIYRNARMARREQAPPQPEEAPRELTPAQVSKDVTRFGPVEVGQNYDIVHSTGGMELRAPGGIVKELTTVTEPAVEAGKTVYRPVSYAVLEDGRKVPIGLLKPTGSAPQNIASMGQPNASPEVTSRARPQPAKPVEETPQEADPAFAKVQAAVAKKVASKAEPGEKLTVKQATAKADRSPMVKAIYDARNKYGSQTTYDQVREFAPGATRAQIDKAVKEVQKTLPRLATKTGKDGQPIIYMSKAAPSEGQKMGEAVKTEQFNKAFKAVFKDDKKKAAYLHNFRQVVSDVKNKIDLSENATVNRINQLIKQGKLKVYAEGESDKPLSKITNSQLLGEDDIDYVVENLARPVSKVSKKELSTAVEKEVKSKASDERAKAILSLEKEYNSGSITGTEFLSALKQLEKKYGKAKK